MTERNELNVLVYREGETWVAQGIEHDIAAFAEHPAKLPAAFYRAVMANLCINADLGREGLEGIAPAPGHFRDLWNGADIDFNARETPEQPAPVEIPAFRMAA